MSGHQRPFKPKNMPWSTRLVFAFMAGIALPVMNTLTGKEWRGLEKLPAREGFIVVPNHCTEIDPIVVGHMLYSQNAMPHFLAKDSLFDVPVIGALLRGARQIPVERTGAGAGKSLEGAERVLAEGGAVVVYPEGTLTRDPDLWPMKGRTGAARLALSTGAKVIPVAHWGAQELFPRYAKGFKVFPRKKVRVLVGDPVDLSEFASLPGDKATLEAMTEVIMKDITALLETLRGQKAPVQRWDPAAHHQSTHGRFVDRGVTPTEHHNPTEQHKDDAGTPEAGDAQ